jgi:hypothetical protein
LLRQLLQLLSLSAQEEEVHFKETTQFLELSRLQVEVEVAQMTQPVRKQHRQEAQVVVVEEPQLSTLPMVVLALPAKGLPEEIQIILPVHIRAQVVEVLVIREIYRSVQHYREQVAMVFYQTYLEFQHIMEEVVVVESERGVQEEPEESEVEAQEIQEPVLQAPSIPVEVVEEELLLDQPVAPVSLSSATPSVHQLQLFIKNSPQTNTPLGFGILTKPRVTPSTLQETEIREHLQEQQLFQVSLTMPEVL